MKMFRSNSESNPNKISWTQIVNAIVQALIAALTALGVSSCANALCKHPTPMTIQLHPQCLLGIQGILRNWTFLIFKQV